MAEYVGGDMVRGHIDTIILNSLIDGDKDTGMIRTEIEERGRGKFQLKQGTFYSALQRIVKQGLVLEYRTTGSDGVRRKFYQLTQKGKNFIEKNQVSWAVSQTVINNLLDTAPAKEEEQKTVTKEEVLPTFEPAEKVIPYSEIGEVSDTGEIMPSFLKGIEQLADSQTDISNIENDEAASATQSEITVETISAEENVVSVQDDVEINEKQTQTIEENIVQEEILVSQVSEQIAESENEQVVTLNTEYNNQVEALTKEIEVHEENVVKFDQLFSFIDSIDPEINTDIKTDEQPQIVDTLTFDKDVVANEEVKTISEVAAVELVTENVVEHKDENPVVEAVYEASHDTKTISYQQIGMGDSPAYNPADDDYLDVNNVPEQRYYKDVLTKLFAVNQKNTVQQQNHSEYPYSRIADELNDADSIIVDKLDFENKPEIVSEKSNQHETNHKYAKSQRHAVDYSDILQLADEEGLRINTSYQTNKSELGKILINKLNFHTSFVFFILVLCETLIIALSINHIVNYSFTTYLIFCFAVAILPLVYIILYSIAPQKAVTDITDFKTAFETILIITLNIILIILAYAIVINLDFNSANEVLSKLVLPILVALNIPLFIIIRYLLLQNQTYFS